MNAARINVPESMEILGVRVHKVTLQEALECLEHMARNELPHMVITLNSEMIMMAQRDYQFREIINSASLSLPDTIGILWASRVLGDPLPERLPGVDTVEHFVQIASGTGIRFFLLGAAPGVAEGAAQKLKERYPSLIVCGTFAGSPRLEDEDEICVRVRAASPHVLLVAYAVPEQEFWIARNLQRLNVPVIINVGATFDYIAGVRKRAPRWMRKLGLEWFFRLLYQPSRWRRMLSLPQFASAVIRTRFTLCRNSDRKPIASPTKETI